MEVEVKGICWITIQLWFSKKWGKKKMDYLRQNHPECLLK